MEQKPKEQAVVKYENMAESVLAKINGYMEAGTMKLPPNYVVENQLRAAWLILQETKDKNQNPVLTSCTQPSIARAMFDMVLQGLSAVKKQCYFVAYGNKLECVRSYFGSIAVAKNAGGVTDDPIANVIYEDDVFTYEIEPETGRVKIISHEQKFENIQDDKIKGAYCVVQKENRTEVTLMTIAQIRKAWEQGATKGQSPAHKNFAAEMCKRTVINRACKIAINSSNDAWIYEGLKDEETLDGTEQRNGEVSKAPEPIKTVDVTFEDVTPGVHTTREKAPEKAPEPEPEPVATNGEISSPGF